MLQPQSLTFNRSCTASISHARLQTGSCDSASASDSSMNSKGSGRLLCSPKAPSFGRAARSLFMQNQFGRCIFRETLVHLCSCVELRGEFSPINESALKCPVCEKRKVAQLKWYRHVLLRSLTANKHSSEPETYEVAMAVKTVVN